jgi:tRNA/tmRNA/rRNA uracil-C5-methylase (TrmA/RlmC/RlmD family)
MGVFGLALARQGARVTVLEADRDAVAAGRQAATAAGLRARFVLGDVLRSLDDRALPRADLVLADPPRSGLGPGVAARMAALAPEGIVLVSCEPGTLARDLRELHVRGYEAQRVVPVDLFPQTPHVETVTRLRRADA